MEYNNNTYLEDLDDEDYIETLVKNHDIHELHSIYEGACVNCPLEDGCEYKQEHIDNLLFDGKTEPELCNIFGECISCPANDKCRHSDYDKALCDSSIDCIGCPMHDRCNYFGLKIE